MPVPSCRTVLSEQAEGTGREKGRTREEDVKRETHPRAGQTGGRRRRSDGAGKTGSREQGDENEVGRTRELRIGVEAESRAQRGIARPENATPPEDCAIAHPLVFYPLVVAFHPGLPSSHSPVRGCPLGLAFLLLSIRDPRAHGLILRSDGVYTNPFRRSPLFPPLGSPDSTTLSFAPSPKYLLALRVSPLFRERQDPL